MSRKLLVAMSLGLGLGFSSLACGSDASGKNDQAAAGSSGSSGSSGGSGGSGGSAGGSGGSAPLPSGNQLTDVRDGHAYATKAIGAQVWMAENLAVGAPYNPKVCGGACMSSQELVGDIQRWCPQTYPNPSTPSPCELYNGYYTWAQALALPASCNTTDCSAQIQTPHHGICPAGFHIPSKSDFETLASFVATQTGLSAKDEMGRYSQVGAALRTNSACDTPGTEAPGVGFNGLPSGYAEETGYVTANGLWTFFQSTTQDTGYSYGWHLSCADDLFSEGLYYKDHALPVRCLKD